MKQPVKRTSMCVPFVHRNVNMHDSTSSTRDAEALRLCRTRCVENVPKT